jgi:hypothetical protein
MLVSVPLITEDSVILTYFVVGLFLGGVSGTHPVLFWCAFAFGLISVDLLASFETWWLGQWAEQYVLYPGWKVSIS